MFSICRTTHQATGIEHCVWCGFFSTDERCLVTAGANVLKVFKLVPDMDSVREKLEEGVPPKMRLECLMSHTLWGNIMSMTSVRVAGLGRDLLLVSFAEAKLAVLQYDPETHGLNTMSLHYFEEDDMKGGWTSNMHIPIIRVDPENRCIVMLLYGRRLAVIPLRKENSAENGDITDIKPIDSKMTLPSAHKTPIMASYVIVLKELDEKIDNVIDIQFLYGYYEPTLLLLYEPVKTFPGRTAVRLDTCAMLGVSLNLQARVHPSIWAVSGLPFDCVAAVPIQRPLGGCLILAVNSIIYLNQSIPPYGVSLNAATYNSTNFPLKNQEGVCISLEGVCVSTLGPQKLVLSLRSGQLYLLTLVADSVRSIRAFYIDKAASSVLTTCMCICEENFLFLGSRLGNSLLLRYTEKDRQMLLNVERPTASIDLTVDENTSANKKRRMESLSDCMASDVQQIRDQDELEVYGSDTRTSTELTSYMFEVCDSLLNIGPIGSISMGVPAFVETVSENCIELVTTSGYGKNGALCILRRSVRPQLVTTFQLPGCMDMWTVLADGQGVVDITNNNPEEGLHSYLLLSQINSTMVLQTGQEINEIDNSGFMTSAPTIFAGNVGHNKYIVQITTTGIRLIKGNQMLQYIAIDTGIVEGHITDPYVCILCEGGKVSVFALREGVTKTGARLASLRHSPPAQPHAAHCILYRDLSGMFSSQPIQEDTSFIKGEFAVKKGKKRNMKKEGVTIDPDIINIEEDEMLYGGDQTPASMVSLMQSERDQRDIITGTVRKDWWKKSLSEQQQYSNKQSSYWLFIVRTVGNLEIYSLPEMKLCFLIRDIAGGAKVLTDSLESVNFLVGQTNPEDLLSDIPQTYTTQKLREILMVGLGNKGSRPLLLLRTETELMIYQVFQYPRGNLKMRFRRILIPIPRLSDKNSKSNTAGHDVKKLRYFSNISGYNGVFVCGTPSFWILLPPRGEIRCHPHAPPQGQPHSNTVTFAPFNNVNCSHGFLYFNSQSELRICVLPTHLSYDAGWPVRKVPVRATPHHVTYHVESRTYCVAVSQPTPTTSYYKFNGEDKELSDESIKGERFPYPLQEKFAIMLFSPVSWEIIPNTRIELEPWEHVTCLKNVNLVHEETRSGLRGYVVVGTNYNYGEDITSRGRILIYDVIEVVPEPGQPLTKNKFKEIYAKEQKGPVTALAQVNGFLCSAVGSKIYIWQLKDNDLVGVAFIDTQVYVHRILTVKSMVLAADVYRSVSLMRFQENHRTLSLVARDIRPIQIYDMELLVDNSNLGFFASESDGNFVLFMYQPQARESFGGQRLIRKADYHLGQKVNCMFRIACNTHDDSESIDSLGEDHQSSANDKKHCTMFTTLDGGLGYVLPISEKVYRRLFMLQNVMNNYICHIAGLNPKAHRTYKSGKKVPGGPARGILDGDLISQFLCLPEVEKTEISKKIGAKEEEIFTDLAEIEKLTALF